MDRVMKLASQKAAVIFSKSSCCMCHAIKTLFYDLDVNPAIHDLIEHLLYAYESKCNVLCPDCIILCSIGSASLVKSVDLPFVLMKRPSEPNAGRN
ncbi:hypothetical protein Scep_006560 [Stephania cephalantha]|uniref:Glutaredoxin domain-containing protein n=1 Tax=Stephania cephalantha TaxID=152367 RepID=A0AAP0PK72_9MAGN